MYSDTEIVIPPLPERMKSHSTASSGELTITYNLYLTSQLCIKVLFCIYFIKIPLDNQECASIPASASAQIPMAGSLIRSKIMLVKV